MFTGAKVLIVEDDPRIVDFLRVGLAHEGFEVSVANDGEAGIRLFHQYRPDAVILDLKLPKVSGEEVCNQLRAQSSVPILVLTARGEVTDKVRLLELGADDYVVKPFGFDDLVARLRALLRRGLAANTEELTFLDIRLRQDTRGVTRDGKPIELSANEFDILRLLMFNSDRVLTKDTILNHVWGHEYLGDSNIVEVYVALLRRKLGEPSVIQTVRGFGYCLRAEA